MTGMIESKWSALSTKRRGVNIQALFKYVACCVFISFSENERIRHRVTDMYADFVQQVDPKGYVMDHLIQRRIISEEDAQKLRDKETRQDRCRAMLHDLLNSGNPKAFVVLREALQQDYPYVVDRIDEQTTGECTLSQCK